MGEAEQVGDTLGVEKILCSNAGRHESDPTAVGGGSVRGQLAYIHRQQQSDPGGALTPRGLAET